MKTLKILLLSCSFFGFSRCENDALKLPKVEQCLMGHKKVFCTDKRLPEDEQVYERSFKEVFKYRLTNNLDYEALARRLEEISLDLYECENAI